MAKSTFLYVTYIRTTPERLWDALTDPAFIKQYWFGCIADSTFKTGDPWKLMSAEGKLFDDGDIIEATPPRRLVIRWRHENRPELKAEGDAICTMDLEPHETAVRLTVTHSIERENSKFIEAVSCGWPKILSNLKSLIETGQVAYSTPYPPEASKA
jgi:uncharacterized protein YndB with AHSA1/START domain